MMIHASKQIKTLKVLFITAVMAVFSLGLAGPRPASAAAGENVLYAGQCLVRNQYLQSSNGLYTMWLQNDGNWVLYSYRGTTPWFLGSHPDPSVGTAYLCMQTDGNLVVYNQNWTAYWWSNSVGKGGDRFYVQDDGNMVIYTPGYAAVWQSYTAGQ